MTENQQQSFVFTLFETFECGSYWSTHAHTYSRINGCCSFVLRKYNGVIYKLKQIVVVALSGAKLTKTFWIWIYRQRHMKTLFMVLGRNWCKATKIAFLGVERQPNVFWKIGAVIDCDSSVLCTCIKKIEWNGVDKEIERDGVWRVI